MFNGCLILLSLIYEFDDIILIGYKYVYLFVGFYYWEM